MNQARVKCVAGRVTGRGMPMACAFGRLSNRTGTLANARPTGPFQDDQGFLWFRHAVWTESLRWLHVQGVRSRYFAPPNSLSGCLYILRVQGSVGFPVDRFRMKHSTGFDPKTEVFTHYRLHRPGSDQGDATVGHIAQDDEGNIWLATGSGLYRLDPSSGRTTHIST